jgi:hypothetical protein
MADVCLLTNWPSSHFEGLRKFIWLALLLAGPCCAGAGLQQFHGTSIAKRDDPFSPSRLLEKVHFTVVKKLKKSNPRYLSS